MNTTQQTISSLLTIALVIGVGYFLFSQKKVGSLLIQEPQIIIVATSSQPVTSTDSSFRGTPELLYKEGGYTYLLYVVETAGSMPVVKESSSTQEYTGISLGYENILSPNKHSFVSISNSGDMCIEQIDPHIAKCATPLNDVETFIYGYGMYDQYITDGVWLDNRTFEFKVYKKVAKPGSDVYKNTEIIRTQVIKFD